MVEVFEAQLDREDHARIVSHGLATCFWGFSTFAARPLINVFEI